MPKTPSVAIYCRISRDRAGTMLGVERQERECRELAERLGWTVVAVHVDDDISAFSGKKRPGYEALLDLLRSGEVNAVLAWHPDRLHRSTKELEGFIDVIEASKAKVATVQAGQYDLTTPSGRMTARIVGAVARGESEHKAERLRSKHAELARAGLPSGGGSRPFGYSREREVYEPEAVLVRQAAHAIIAGKSLHSVCVRWNRDGIATSTGNRWTTGALSKLLRSPHIAGQREHHGVLYAASWPGLVTLDDGLRLRSILAPTPGPKAVAKFPLSGLLACGSCGTRLVASSEKRRDGSRARRYRCALSSGGCNKVGIVAVPLEDLVLAQTVAFLDSFHARPVAGIEPESDQQAVDDLNKIAERRAELASMFARDEVDASSWRMAIAALDEREAEARTKVAAVAAKRNVFTPFVLDGETGQRLLESWPTMDHDERRTELRKAIDHVVIAHVDKAANRFDPSRVQIVWREGFRLDPVTLAPRSTWTPIPRDPETGLLQWKKSLQTSL